MNNQTFINLGIDPPKTLKIRKDSKYQGELEKINTEAKAYLLGFLYADGCISKLSSKTKNYYVRISLSIEDIDIVEKLYSFFPFFCKREHDFSKYNKNNKRQVELRYYSKFIFKDLKMNGLIERKSYENKNLLRIPPLQEDIIHHFIRGFFDGDGSISIAKSRPNLRRVEICTVSLSFITDLIEWFTSKGCPPGVFREKNTGKQSLYVIEWINSKSILKLKDLMYNNSSIYLERKKEKFFSFYPINKTDKGIFCPYCNYDRVHFIGERKMKKDIKVRIRCNKCKRSFSLPKAEVKSDKLLENPKKDNQQPITNLND